MMSRLRMVCPACLAGKQSCWICDDHGHIEFWVRDDELEIFQHDACIVLETKTLDVGEDESLMAETGRLSN